MKKAVWLIALCALSAFATDLSGKWTGTFSFEENGQAKSVGAYMDLKQDGAKLTGLVGPDTTKLLSIENGTVEGNKIHFEVQEPEGSDAPMVFDLTIDGDHMTGSVRGEHEGERRDAKIDVKRAA